MEVQCLQHTRRPVPAPQDRLRYPPRRCRPLDSAELQTRIGVAHLMATYQLVADQGKVRPLTALFALDAVLEETSYGTFTGTDSILEFFTYVRNGFLASDILPARHHLSSVHIDVLPDGHASTYACFQFVGSRGLDHWGTYRDEVVRTDDGWRFLRRQITTEGAVPDSPVRKILGDKI